MYPTLTRNAGPMYGATLRGERRRTGPVLTCEPRWDVTEVEDIALVEIVANRPAAASPGVSCAAEVRG
jgi:hypothetical protein